MRKTLPAKQFSIHNAAFWICNEEETECITDDDVRKVVEWLKVAVFPDHAIRISYKDASSGKESCNYLNTNVQFFYPYGSPIDLNRMYVSNINLLRYLDRLFNWLSGKGFSSHYDKEVLLSLLDEESPFGHPRHDEITKIKFKGGLKGYEDKLNTESNSFSPSKWLPIIENAIKRLQPGTLAENKQDIRSKEKALSTKSESDRSDNLQKGDKDELRLDQDCYSIVTAAKILECESIELLRLGAYKGIRFGIQFIGRISDGKEESERIYRIINQPKLFYVPEHNLQRLYVPLQSGHEVCDLIKELEEKDTHETVYVEHANWPVHSEHKESAEITWKDLYITYDELEKCHSLLDQGNIQKQGIDQERKATSGILTGNRPGTSLQDQDYKVKNAPKLDLTLQNNKDLSRAVENKDLQLPQVNPDQLLVWEQTFHSGLEKITVAELKDIFSAVMSLKHDQSRHMIIDLQAKLKNNELYKAKQIFQNLFHEYQQVTGLINQSLGASFFSNIDAQFQEISLLFQNHAPFQEIKDRLTTLKRLLKKTLNKVFNYLEGMQQNLNSLVQDTLIAQEDVSHSQGIQFKLVPEAEENMPELFLDKDKMTDALRNLIKNAAESFSPEQEEKLITIRTHRNQSTIELWVIDNGQGIEKNRLETIFDPGYTTKGSDGLGLAIVKKTISNNMGQISVESKLDQGASFKIVFEV